MFRRLDPELDRDRASIFKHQLAVDPVAGDQRLAQIAQQNVIGAGREDDGAMRGDVDVEQPAHVGDVLQDADAADFGA